MYYLWVRLLVVSLLIINVLPVHADESAVTDPPNPCDAFRFNHVEAILQDGYTANLSIEWPTYPGAVWYRVFVVHETGQVTEYLRKGDQGMLVPVSEIPEGRYQLRVVALDEAQTPLCRSEAIDLIKQENFVSVVGVGAPPSLPPPPDLNGDVGHAVSQSAAPIEKPNLKPASALCVLESREAYAILWMTNKKRAAENLPPLRLNRQLSAAACRQSGDMYTHRFMRHIGTDSSTFDQRILEAGYQGTPGGENIAQHYQTAWSVFQAWWASPGHAANILGDYGPNGEMGLARVGDYWTQTFGQPDG